MKAVVIVVLSFLLISSCAAQTVQVLLTTGPDTVAISKSWPVYPIADGVDLCADVLYSPPDRWGGGLSVAAERTGVPVIDEIMQFVHIRRLGAGVVYRDEWDGILYGEFLRYEF
jgi:hypothetical protein